MVFRRLVPPAVAGSLLLFAGGAVAQRQPVPGALAKIERGQWQLTERNGGARKLCLTAAATLVQLQHAGTSCQQTVEAEDERSATIRYTCPGHGHGRTRISVETPRLVKIETQGVADGAPFLWEYEGRRVGACG